MVLLMDENNGHGRRCRHGWSKNCYVVDVASWVTIRRNVNFSAAWEKWCIFKITAYFQENNSHYVAIFLKLRFFQYNIAVYSETFNNGYYVMVIVVIFIYDVTSFFNKYYQSIIIVIDVLPN